MFGNQSHFEFSVTCVNIWRILVLDNKFQTQNNLLSIHIQTEKNMLKSNVERIQETEESK